LNLGLILSKITSFFCFAKINPWHECEEPKNPSLICEAGRRAGKP